jgi:hypothetical protein
MKRGRYTPTRPTPCEHCGKIKPPRRSTEAFSVWVAKRFCSNECASASRRTKVVSHGQG